MPFSFGEGGWVEVTKGKVFRDALSIFKISVVNSSAYPPSNQKYCFYHHIFYGTSKMISPLLLFQNVESKSFPLRPHQFITPLFPSMPPASSSSANGSGSPFALENAGPQHCPHFYFSK